MFKWVIQVFYSGFPDRRSCKMQTYECLSPWLFSLCDRYLNMHWPWWNNFGMYSLHMDAFVSMSGKQLGPLLIFYLIGFLMTKLIPDMIIYCHFISNSIYAWSYIHIISWARLVVFLMTPNCKRLWVMIYHDNDKLLHFCSLNVNCVILANALLEIFSEEIMSAKSC